MMKLNFFRTIFLFTILISYLSLEGMQPLNAAPQTNHCPEAVWNGLKRGNKKFINNPKYARQRARFADHQNPGCVILGCSDSRVPPELVFTQGIGEQFVVRTAGEVVDDVVVDSIEYAVTHHDTHLIVVLGHTKCGAVIGALEHLRRNGGRIDPVNGHLNAVLIPIEIAIVRAGINIYGPNALEQSIRANIRYQAELLISESKPIASEVANGTLAIIGAEYNLKTGKVKQLFVKGKL